MSLEANKKTVQRFNDECIGKGVSFEELLSVNFINRTAPPGAANGPESIQSFFNDNIRPGLSNLHVEIHDQIAEGDKVVTRKTIHGVHTGSLMGVAPTGRSVSINVIDIVRLEDGKYVEHWGINNLKEVIATLIS
ncbi:MAG TPA: ester cyclase [Bdellovibrio sp.]|uniref:ester cyclase n=1 Tax=Bdellovibrio sp. TaxID=28201 RepID=UPI002EF9D9DD